MWGEKKQKQKKEKGTRIFYMTNPLKNKTNKGCGVG